MLRNILTTLKGIFVRFYVPTKENLKKEPAYVYFWAFNMLTHLAIVIPFWLFCAGNVVTDWSALIGLPVEIDPKKFMPDDIAIQAYIQLQLIYAPYNVYAKHATPGDWGEKPGQFIVAMWFITIGAMYFLNRSSQGYFLFDNVLWDIAKYTGGIAAGTASVDKLVVVMKKKNQPSPPTPPAA